MLQPPTDTKPFDIFSKDGALEVPTGTKINGMPLEASPADGSATPAGGQPPEAQAQVAGTAAPDDHSAPAPTAPQTLDAPEPWKPTDLPEHMTPEAAYGMARYMQGQFDSARTEIEQLRAQYEAMTRQTPATPPPPTNLPPAPQPITIPDDVDLYGEQGEKVLRAALSQVGQLQQQIQQMNAQQEALQQQTQQQAQRERAISHFQHTKGVPRHQAEAFVDAYQRGNITDDLIFDAWRGSQKPTAEQVRRQQAFQQAQQAQQQRLPTAAVSAPAGGTPPPTGPRLMVPTKDTGAFDLFQS